MFTNFTFKELLAIASVCILIAITALPLLAAQQADGKDIACTNQLKRIAMAQAMYTSDNRGWLAPAYVKGGNTWYNMIYRYINTGSTAISNKQFQDTFRCPAENLPVFSGKDCFKYSHYGQNTHLTGGNNSQPDWSRIAKLVPEPAKAIHNADLNYTYTYTVKTKNLTAWRHGINIRKRPINTAVGWKSTGNEKASFSMLDGHVALRPLSDFPDVITGDYQGRHHHGFDRSSDGCQNFIY